MIITHCTWQQAANLQNTDEVISQAIYWRTTEKRTLRFRPEIQLSGEYLNYNPQ